MISDTFWDNDMQQKIALAVNEHKKTLSVYQQEHYINYVIFSVWDKDYPDNLDDIAVHGRVKFISPDYTDYSVIRGWSYESKVVENPTWYEIIILANDMINMTRDIHHVYLEGIDCIQSFAIDEESFIKIYTFSMGS